MDGGFGLLLEEEKIIVETVITKREGGKSRSELNNFIIKENRERNLKDRLG